MNPPGEKFTREILKRRSLQQLEILLRRDLSNKTYLIVEGNSNASVFDKTGLLSAREFFKSALLDAYVDPEDYEEYVSNIEKRNPETLPGTRDMAKLKIVPGTLSIRRTADEIEVAFDVFNLNNQTSGNVALSILITYGKTKTLWLSIMGNEFFETDFTKFGFK